MSKKTREEKRAEERRIIAEMEAAMKEKAETEEVDVKAEESAEDKVEKKEKTVKKQVYHCPRCRTTLQDDGHCPTCNYKIYVPMDEKQRNKVKLILTVVFMVIFVVLFVCLQIKK